jgi:hypothetical protein
MKKKTKTASRRKDGVFSVDSYSLMGDPNCHGKVRGGTGYQVYVPEDVDVTAILRHVAEKPLKE